MGDDLRSQAGRPLRLKAWDEAPSPFVTPSLLNCNFSKVGEELDALKRDGVVAVHLDVMDGHFVENLSYGPPVIADWRKRTDFTFDTHLMMTNPGEYLDAFVKAGCDLIIFQIEAVPEPLELIGRIKAAGCRASIAINPPTPLSAIEPYLDLLDAVLVMSVMPGKGGQSFKPEVLDKVRAIRASHPKMWISIDGGIKADTAELAVAAGVNQMVVGTGVFVPDGNYAAALAKLAEGIRRGLERGSAPAPAAGPPSQ